MVYIYIYAETLLGRLAYYSLQLSLSLDQGIRYLILLP